MTPEAAKEFVRALLAAPATEARAAMLSERQKEIGPLFFEFLAVEAPEPVFSEVIDAYYALHGEQQAKVVKFVGRLLSSGTVDFRAVLAEVRDTELEEDIFEQLILVAEMAISSHGDLDLGTRAINTARQMSEGGRFPSLQPSLELHAGNLQLKLGDYDAAEASFTRGFALLGDNPSALVTGALLVSYGALLITRRRFPEAAHLYEQITPRISDDTQRLVAKNNLAWIYACQGRFGTALKMLLELKKESETCFDVNVRADVLGNLAIVAYRLGLDEAYECFLFDAHELRRNPPTIDAPFDWEGIAESCTNIALFYRRRGDFSRASDWLAQRAYALGQSGKLRENLVVDQRLAIGLALAAKQSAEAWRLSERCALDFLSDALVPSTDDEILLVANAALAAFATDQFETSLLMFTRLSDLCVANKSDDLLASHLGYRACALFALGRPNEALDSIDKMIAIERRMRNDLDNPLHQFTFSGLNESLHDDLIELLLRIDEKKRLFEIIQISKAFAVTLNQSRAATFDELCSSLPPRTAFLEYDGHGEGSFCMIVAEGMQEPDLVDLNLEDSMISEWAIEFERRLNWARYALDDAPFDMLEAPAKFLLAPVLAALPLEIEHLIIAPAGAAARLPFHIFPIGRKQRAIDKYAISYAPSATSWLASQRRSHFPESAAIIVHSRNNDPKIVNDFFIQEGERVDEKIKRRGIKTQRVKDCDQSMFFRNLSVGLLHVAAHGEFSPAEPQKTGLLLSDGNKDVLISLDIIGSAKAHCELIFLSGCDTGRVTSLRNQEILGLMSILLGKNVSATALSFWPIPGASPVVVRIIEKFYDSWLLDGQSKAQALRTAMLSERDALIYDWAGFGLFGFAAET